MAKTPLKNSQERDSKTWEIVQLFYCSLIEFREIFDHYEKQVLDKSVQRGQDRVELRLSPEDLAGLMDYKALELLRDKHIFELKDRCHEIFRGRHRADLLDIYISDVFHEISILKEEYYNVKTYAPKYAKDSREVELSYIVDELHNIFPSKLKHIHYLFGKARERMEELFSSFTKNRILIRSLYLMRDDFVKNAYEGGLKDFYKFMYPKLGPVEGYYEVAMSFCESSFFRHAMEAFRYAELEINSTENSSVKLKKLSKDIHSQILKLLDRNRGVDSSSELSRSKV